MKRRGLVLVCLVVALVAALVGSASGQGSKSAKIKMTEFEFGLPNGGKLPKGKVKITYKNTGRFPHNFTIVATSKGATGKSALTSKTVEGGKSQSKTVTLKPGAYVAICTVFNGGHFAQGMVTKFTVGTFDQENGSWK